MPRRISNKEESIQIAVSKFIKLAYPNVVFTSESSGVRVNMGTAIKMKKQRSNHKLPDMIILEPRNGYHGLCLELKKSRQGVYLKNGSLSSLEHIQEQQKTLNVLTEKGYLALFACGIDEALQIIQKYLK